MGTYTDKFKTIDERVLENSLGRYIFRWNNIPKKFNENDKLRNFLKYFLQEIGIERIEDINFSKQNENTINIIIHNKSLNLSLFIRLIREENKAILTEEDDVLYEFVVRGKFRLGVYSADKDPKLILGSIKAV